MVLGRLGWRSRGGKHVENSKQRACRWVIWETLSYLRRKDDGVASNYRKDPCVERALECGRGILTTARSALTAWHAALTNWAVCETTGPNQASWGELSQDRGGHGLLKALPPPHLKRPLCTPTTQEQWTWRSGFAQSCRQVWEGSEPSTPRRSRASQHRVLH